jgi:starch phosphorylase
MVKEYYDRFYLKSSSRWNTLSNQDFQAATNQATWCNKLRTSWNDVTVENLTSDNTNEKKVGESVEILATVKLGDLVPEDVTVEVYYGTMDHQGEFADRDTHIMDYIKQSSPGVYTFKASISCEKTGRFGYTVRVMPSRERLGNPFVLGLVSWA